MVDTLPLPAAVELAEKIKNSYRARWDEVRYQDERSGDISPTQYDLTLEMKGGKEQLTFSHREIEGQRRWYFQMLVEDPLDGGAAWVNRHDREAKWVSLPDMLAQSLWDVVTVHGDDAAKRGWSEIDRKEPAPDELAESAKS